MIKKLVTALTFFGLSSLAMAQTLPDQLISQSEYDAMKANGTLNPAVHYTIDLATVTPPDPRATPPVVNTNKAGGCDCYIPPDASYTLAMGPNDDNSTPMLNLPFNFCLYGNNYTNFWINNNGNVTFDVPYGTFSAVGFPSASYVMVAPFWADVDTRGAGQVWYKITPTALYVAWVGVGYFNTQSDKINTFSLIITDGNDPVIGVGNNVAFCYEDMQWTTGSASSGVNGFGGVPATVGCNKGDGIDFVQYGRFDQPGTAYDGPVGANDGVSWLDNQSLIFNACNTTNISPTLSGGISLCDTIEICLGDTIVDTIDVLSPEVGQFTTISAVSSSPDFQILNITNGNIAHLAYSVVGAAVGTFTVSITAFDDGVPPDTVTFNIVFQVNPNNTPDPVITGDTIICPGELTILTATGGPYDEYTWSPIADYDSTLNVNSGGIYSVTVRLDGCSQRDSITVYQLAAPSPHISGTTAICNGDSAILVVDNGPFGSYSWSNGDTDSITAVITAGTYTVTVTDVCSGSATISVTVENPTINIISPPSVCAEDSVLMTATPVVSFVDLLWSNGSTTSTSYAQGPGTYSVVGTTALGCTATDNVVIALLPAPQGNIVLPPIACDEQAAEFSFNNTGIPVNNYYWDFGVSPSGDNSNLPAPTYVYPNSALTENYPVTLVLVGNNGCVDTIQTTVSIHPQPEAAFNMPPSVCEGFSAPFSLVIVGDTIGTYEWLFPSGVPSYSSDAQPNIFFPTPGIVPVQVTITTEYGCSTVVNQDYIVKENPNPDFEVYPICISRFTFDPIGTPDNSTAVLDWYMGDGTSFQDKDTSFFNYNYSGPGTYQVTLVTTDSAGCIDSITKPVEVLDNIQVQAPTILYRSSSINNFKADMEYKYPGFNLCIDYTYTVFDRWGVKVFEMHNDPLDPDMFCNKCFTGKDQNGNMLSAGVYYFILEGNFKVHEVGYITVLD